MTKSPECLFCKIANRQIPAHILSESKDWIVFRDIEPQAPVHCLIVPKKHMTNMTEASPESASLIGSMLIELARLAAEHHVDQSGFRIVNNCNRDAGQSVDHLHFHLLGGRPMNWPPG